jgi:UDPglucose 6-dehydrogenase
MSVKIAMIGCGKLGSPCGEVMSEKFNVVGYDITPTNCSFKMVGSICEAIKGCSFIFIAVPTPHHKKYGGEAPTHQLPPRDFDYTAIKSVIEEINRVVKQEQIVVLISTVLPGTIRREIAPLLPNATLLYNPYLIAMGTVKEDMVNPECLIIGTDTGEKTREVKKLISLYKKIINCDVPVNIGTWEEAESIKIFYNTFISLKISFVNMIQDVAEYVGNINVDVVTNALKNATQRIVSTKYMTAGLGDGGACHPRDNIALRFLSQKANLGYNIFQDITKYRDIQAKNLAKYIKKVANDVQLPVLIHGVSYKPNVHYTNGSYSLLIASYLKQFDVTFSIVDKNIPEYNDVTVHNKVVVFLSHPIKTEKELLCIIPYGSVIIDPWRSFNSSNYKVIHYGNTRNTINNKMRMLYQTNRLSKR